MFRHFAKYAVLLSLVGLHGCDDVPDLSPPNAPPVANDDDITITQNQSIVLEVRANDTDVDGDQLTVAILPTSQPTNGEAENLSGLIRYTPDLYFIGNDEFSYEITDTAGHTDTAVVSITINKHETRAVFSATTGTEEKIYMIDSRDPGTLVDLGQALDAGEQILNWLIEDNLQLVVMLTDADRIVTASLDEPATIVNSFDIDTTNGAPDGGLILSFVNPVVIYTLDHRYGGIIDLTNVNPLIEFDTGFATGDMLPSYFSPRDNGFVMEGTLGAAGSERSAIYFVRFGTLVSTALNSLTPTVIQDDPAVLSSTFSRPVSATSMLWLLDDAPGTMTPAAFTCAAPPPQNLSALSFSTLVTPDASVDLNAGSGLMPDPTDVISYNTGPAVVSAYVAACPPATDIVQILQIPFLTPANASVIAMGDDASDGLWNININTSGATVLYTIEGDTGLRTISLDMTGMNPVATDLTGTVPGFQTYTSGGELRLPPSGFSADNLRWVYLAPVADSLTKLEWLQLASSELSSVDLPFTATNVVSDGFYAFVQGETGDAGSAPVAFIDLNNPQVTPVDLTGILPETVIDPLNRIESAVALYPVP